MGISDQTPTIQGATDGTEIGNVLDSLKIVDYLNDSGTQGIVSVTTTATPIYVSGSNFANRKLLTIYNDSSNVLYWGFTNAVTISTGTPLEKKQFLALSVGPNVTVYMIAVSGSNSVRITESA